MVASIPSPSSGALELGPVSLRAYGVMIALGVLAAVWLAQRRHNARGGAPDDFTVIAMWAVPAGLVGARLYHVITDWRDYRGRWEDVVKIWEGGLGIPGGLVAGVLVGVLVAHRRGISIPYGLDTVAPALLVAQAIGRVGNWFNQELFGRPTDLPWGLEIDPDRRPVEHLDQATFHPTFLYEGLWNLGLCGVLLWVDRFHRQRPGRLMALYVSGYGLGRLWVELLRIDPASRLGGVRVNVWVSLVAIVAGAVAWWWLGRRPLRPGDLGPAGDGADDALEPASTGPDDAGISDTADRAG